MKIKVKYFGQIAEISGVNEEILNFQTALNSAELNEFINQKYELQNTSYQISVNQKISKDPIKLEDKDEVALLPPFAGG